MTKNLILTGLMGAGKTSVGIILAQKLYFEFIDTDKLIEQKNNCSINDIFSNKGEAFFREQEYEVIKELSASESKVISLGGGSLENHLNLELVKQNGILFYLKADASTLYNRIKTDTKRPLLNVENPLEVLENLIKKREKNYLLSDKIINTNGKNIDETVEEILQIWQELR